MVSPTAHAYWIPLFPLLGFLWILLSGLLKRWSTGDIRISDRWAFFPSVTMVALSWFWSIAVLIEVIGKGPGTAYHLSYPWLQSGILDLRFGYLVDSMTAIMLIVVTTVATMVQVYSYGYMAGEARFPRFYAYLSLFTMAMLILVLANNLLELFIAWELMGLASYLLIGFWFEKPSAMRAAKKAFMVTRMGDVGLFFGLAMLIGVTGTLNFMGLVVAMPDGSLPANVNGWINGLAVSAGPAILNNTSPIFGGAVAGSTVLGITALLIFCGSIGKSAQFPLHVWLPDAMEGPTPVSALIHAATMVAAGVYLVARMYPVFDYGGPLQVLDWSFRPLNVVAVIGTITALMAAVIALTQPDIKRILAYSTISQLGFMIAGLGCGGAIMAAGEGGEGAHHGPELLHLGFTAGMFHLMTHAFFKGLLFLGSGSVIHGTGTQDVWEMGGLKRYMPKTFWTYFIGFAALAGVPGLAGFFSKDAILDAAHEFNPLIFWVLVFTAGLTAFYMTRQMMLVFSGEWSGGAAQGLGHTEPLSNPDASLHAEDHTDVGHEQEEQGRALAEAGHPPTQADHAHADDAHAVAHGLDVHGHAAHAHDDADPTAHGPDAHAAHDDHGHGHHGDPHESPWTMVGPLVLLAVLALASGYVGLPGKMQIYQYLHYSRPDTLDQPFHPEINLTVIGAGTTAGLLGILLGYLAYQGRRFNWSRTENPGPLQRALYAFSYQKMYFDELYWNILIVPMFLLTRSLRFMDVALVDGLVRGVGYLGLGLAWLWGAFDRVVIDGFVNGLGRSARAGGEGLRYLQSGQIQNYVLVAFTGIVVLIWALTQSYLFK
jgi:NAD(P)H-quinone oxidoreductase subunit 5